MSDSEEEFGLLGDYGISTTEDEEEANHLDWEYWQGKAREESADLDKYPYKEEIDPSENNEGIYILEQYTNIPMEHKEKFNVWNIPVPIKKGCVYIAKNVLIGDEESINNGYIGYVGGPDESQSILDYYGEEEEGEEIKILYKLLLEYDIIYSKNLELKNKLINLMKKKVQSLPI